MPDIKIKARFIEPMLLRRAEKLPEGAGWTYELKLDGFRALAIKSGRVHLRSRNDKDFNAKYPAIVQALAAMPDETVIDGEVVALESGRPSFSALQNGSATAPLIYYVFDVMILAGKDVMNEPLSVRRELLAERVLAKLDEPIRESPVLEASLADLISSVKAHGLEGLVAKRRDSRYEPGERSGSLAEDARQPGASIGDRGIHVGREELRRRHIRLLRRRPVDVRRTHPQRIHARVTRSTIQAIPGPGRGRMPVRQPS